MDDSREVLKKVRHGELKGTNKMRLCWLTDIHLNFLDKDRRECFYSYISEKNIDGVIISGDISESPEIEMHLKEMAKSIKCPIYFVMGNHDFYRGSIEETRKSIKRLMKNKLIFWLGNVSLQLGGTKTCLIGADGFCDGQNGDFFYPLKDLNHIKFSQAISLVWLNDSNFIEELKNKNELEIIDYRVWLKNELLKFASLEANRIKNETEIVINEFNPNKIIIVTHVPPFEESCLYEGKRTHEAYLPFYSSKIMGDTLLELGKYHKNIEFLVLCGHTHSPSTYQPLPNMVVKTGGASYNYPEIQAIIEIESNS